MALALFRAARGSAGALATLRVAAVSSTTKSASPAARFFAAEANAEVAQKGSSSIVLPILLAGGLGAGLYFAKTEGYLNMFLGIPPLPVAAKSVFKPNYEAVKSTIADMLDSDDYDDGSYGPVLVRLAWHASGTYDRHSGTGGSNGATMRFSEGSYGANAGLKKARDFLEPVKEKYPWISYADLWTLAGATAVEEMGGPAIKWRPGRSDAVESANACPPDGRLPNGDGDAKHIRWVFDKMGFSDQEMVALSGAHALGRCHPDRSGWDGPWSHSPITWSNLYFVNLFDEKWTKKKWSGPLQYEDKTKSLMMLPTDMAMIWDKGFKKYSTEYYKDAAKFDIDFAAAFSKLLELGVPFPEATPAAA